MHVTILNAIWLIGNQDVLYFAREVLSYLLDIFDLSNCADFDEGTFQIYQSIGRGLITRFSSNGTHENITARLAAELGSRLDTFNESWQLHSGLGMELLWTAFRPVSAINLRQLELSNQLKDLANRFDALRWVSSTSVQGLCTLQRSMVGIHNAIGSASPLDFRPIEVRQHILLLSIINLLTSV